MFERNVRISLVAALAACVALAMPAEARKLTSTVTEPEVLPRMHPEYPVPEEPNQIFYIERSSNSNTVVYAAKLDANGKLDRREPVVAYWRWYNVDGHVKQLNFAERMLAYGIKSVRASGREGVYSFKIAALPERTIYVELNDKGKPEAYGKTGDRWVRLVYVYLEVDDSGILPDVTGLDFFGYDRQTGKPVHEHVTPH